MAELTRPSIGENQVVQFPSYAGDELGAISNVKCYAPIHPEMMTRNRDGIRVRVDRLDARQLIGAFQDPSRSMTKTCTNFKKAPPRF